MYLFMKLKGKPVSRIQKRLDPDVQKKKKKSLQESASFHRLPLFSNGLT